MVAKLAIGGETGVLNIALGSTLSTYGRATVNVSYQQLNLNEIAGGNAIESYTVQLFSLIAPASRPYTYVLKYEYKPYRRYFVYLNSLGALDTCTTGERTARRSSSSSARQKNTFPQTTS
ncbi:hypothetical protein [Dyadobacter bucti]|uniref:hypothetical protein n=1 Tax=Dyadobacter bucti TaxID=2572203 RepID=UPI003F7244B6